MANPALAITPFNVVLLTTYAAALYTVPANQEHSVSIRLCNYIGGDRTVSLWLVPSGEVLGDKNLRLSGFVIKAADAKDVEIALPMKAGDRIYAAASSTVAIAMSITGTRNDI